MWLRKVEVQRCFLRRNLKEVRKSNLEHIWKRSMLVEVKTNSNFPRQEYVYCVVETLRKPGQLGWKKGGNSKH